jgi:putative LysE/RhtB family amino acid efflux pump
LRLTLRASHAFRSRNDEEAESDLREEARLGPLVIARRAAPPGLEDPAAFSFQVFDSEAGLLPERRLVMDLSLVLRGSAIGFAVAAPVGPIGLLVIRRSLACGALPGLATGLGAAAADTTFALVGSLGLAGAAVGLGAHAGALRVAGALFVVVLGLRGIFERTRASAPAPSDAPSLLGAFATTLLLTLTNPMTILSFAAIAAGAGIAGHDVAASIALASGVLVGSAAWWLLLAGSVAALRRRVPDRALPWIGRASGVFLVAFGVHALLTR